MFFSHPSCLDSRVKEERVPKVVPQDRDPRDHTHHPGHILGSSQPHTDLLDHLEWVVPLLDQVYQVSECHMVRCHTHRALIPSPTHHKDNRYRYSNMNLVYLIVNSMQYILCRTYHAWSQYTGKL